MMEKDKILAIGIFVVLAVFWTVPAFSQLNDDENTNYETALTGETYNISARAPGYQSGETIIDASNTGSVTITLYKGAPPTISPVPCSDAPGATPQPGCPGPSIPPTATPEVTQGPGPTSTPLTSNIKIDRAIIPITAQEGSVTPVSEQLLVKNTGSEDVVLTLKINGQSGLSLNPSRLSLSPDQEVPVFITGDISKLKSNVYPNTLTIAKADGSKINGKASIDVAITVTIQPANRLFDVKIELDTDKKAFVAGDEVPVKVTIKNIGGSTFDVDLDYEVKDSSSGKSIFSDTDKVSGGPEESVTKAIKIPKDAKSGNYQIEAKIKDKGENKGIGVLTIFINGPGGPGPCGIKGALACGQDSGGLMLLIIILMIAGIASAVVYVERGKIWKKGKQAKLQYH